MITISIDPILLSIGHFMIRWYSLIVLAAILVSLWIAGREAERASTNLTATQDHPDGA